MMSNATPCRSLAFTFFFSLPQVRCILLPVLFTLLHRKGMLQLTTAIRNGYSDAVRKECVFIMGNATRQIKRMRQKEQAHTSRPHWSKEKKKKVGIICGIVIAVLLLFLMFWTPAGTVKTWFGKPMFVADNAILVKNNDYYYSLGTYQLPEGYTKDTEYSVVQDKNRFELKADSVDESSPVAFFYMTPVASPDIDSIRNSFHGMYEECSEVKTMTVCGREAQWFDYTYQSDNEDDATHIHDICIYIPAAHDCKVLVRLSSHKTTHEALPTNDDMMTHLDKIVSGLVLD